MFLNIAVFEVNKVLPGNLYSSLLPLIGQITFVMFISSTLGKLVGLLLIARI
jgi:hypothetical protein